MPFSLPRNIYNGVSLCMVHEISLHVEDWNAFSTPFRQLPAISVRITDKVMGRLSKLADFLQKSVTLTCMVGTVYLLVMTGRNYLSLREKRLANAALIEAKAEDEPASAKHEEEQTVSQVHGFQKLKLLVKLQLRPRLYHARTVQQTLFTR